MRPISVCYWFELRFIRPLAALREKYEDFIKSGEREAVHQAHLENHRASIKGLSRGNGIGTLPQLDFQGPDVGDFLGYVLLGIAIGYVLPEESVKGISTLYYAKRKAGGEATSDLIDLGTLDPLEASKRMPLTTFEIIKSDLDQELQNSYQHVEKKKVLLEKLDSLSTAKFIERSRRNTDPVFQDFRAKVEEVKNMVNHA